MATILESYKNEIKRLELVINNITDDSELDSFQDLLNSAFDKYEGEKSLGSELYKLYEYQARVYHAKGMDKVARGFIDKAIEIRGETYKKAIEIKASLDDSDNKNRSTGNKKKSLKGIGGWLAFYIIALVINVIVGIYVISRGNTVSSANCTIIDNAFGSGVCAEMKSAVGVEMFLNSISVICALVSIIMILMKKKSAVTFTVIFCAYCILFQIFELSIISSWASRFPSELFDSSDYTAPITGIFSNALWMTYFLRSQRVKETLVE